MATIYADSGSAPVRIRNLSPTGALIEGPVLPLPGTHVRLTRGSLSIMGNIVWHRDGRAGLRFKSTVSVADWLPQGRAVSAQQRIDEIVQHARTASKGVDPRAPVDCPAPQSTSLSAVDLRQLGLAIQSLSEDLAADPVAVERHGSKLQTLDIVAQALRRIASDAGRDVSSPVGTGG